MEKSGVYKFECSKNCSLYIGQTRRDLETRGKEHLKDFDFRRFERSPVAEHMEEFKYENHNFSINNLSLIKEVNDPFLVKTWESFFIHKFKKQNFNLLNKDSGVINSSTVFDIAINFNIR